MSRLSKLLNTKMSTEILSVLTSLCTAVVNRNRISLRQFLSKSNKFFVCGNSKVSGK